MRFDQNGKAFEEDNILKAEPFSTHKELLTDPVFLIGNGASRKEFDLERLRSIGTILGCNALFRDFIPDVLLAIDAKMLKEIRTSNYDLDHFCIIPHNRSVALKKAVRWKTERYNTTGCFGMKLIDTCMKPKYCYMLGMDGYKGNLYDGTLNYAQQTLANFSGVNAYYMRVLNAAENTIFVNVNDRDEWPKEAHNTKHYQVLSYEEFEKTVMA